MASPNMPSEQDDTNNTPKHINTSEASVLDIPQIEHTYKLLTNVNLYLLIGGGAIALAIGIVSFVADRKGSELFRAKDEENRVKIEQVQGDARRDAARIESDGKKEAARIESEGKQHVAEAKAAQQRVEIDLANQQEKTATAERSLFELRQRIQPRRISSEQRVHLAQLLARGPKGRVTIVCVLGDGEGSTFANDIDSVLKASGWPSEGVDQAAYERNPIGLEIVVRDAKAVPQHAGVLVQAFFAVGIPITGVENPTLPEGVVEIMVGNKQ